MNQKNLSNWKDLRVDSFGDHDVGKSRVKIVVPEEFLHFPNLLLLHLRNLSISDAITVHDDPAWKLSIHLLVLLQGFGDASLDLLQILFIIPVESAWWMKSGQGCVGGCDNSTNCQSFLWRIMPSVISWNKVNNWSPNAKFRQHKSCVYGYTCGLRSKLRSCTCNIYKI